MCDFRVALRIWDAFVLEGRQVLFRVAINLLAMHEHHLLHEVEPEMLYSEVLNLPARLTLADCDAFMQPSDWERGRGHGSSSSSAAASASRADRRRSSVVSTLFSPMKRLLVSGDGGKQASIQLEQERKNALRSIRAQQQERRASAPNEEAISRAARVAEQRLNAAGGSAAAGGGSDNGNRQRRRYTDNSAMRPRGRDLGRRSASPMGVERRKKPRPVSGSLKSTEKQVRPRSMDVGGSGGAGGASGEAPVMETVQPMRPSLSAELLEAMTEEDATERDGTCADTTLSTLLPAGAHLYAPAPPPPCPFLPNPPSFHPFLAPLRNAIF